MPIQYDINGTITFSKRSKPNFDKEISYTSPLGIKVIIQSNKQNDLSVNMKLNAAEDNYAKSIAENELSSICNLLSFYFDCSITEFRVTSFTRSHNDGSDRVVSASDMLCAVDSEEVRKMLSEQNIANLTSILSSEWNSEFVGVLNAWRDTLRQESKVICFLMLFRLLEWVIGGSSKTARKRADKWLKEKEPDKPSVKDENSGEVSIYTFLRDNIHPKRKKVALEIIRDFPFEKINENIVPLQNLVKIAIEEKYQDYIMQL